MQCPVPPPLSSLLHATILNTEVGHDKTVMLLTSSNAMNRRTVLNRAFQTWTIAARRVEPDEYAFVIAIHSFGNLESTLHQSIVVTMSLQCVPLLRYVRILLRHRNLPRYERSIAVLEYPKEVT